jgi:hypothetical protein
MNPHPARKRVNAALPVVIRSNLRDHRPWSVITASGPLRINGHTWHPLRQFCKLAL